MKIKFNLNELIDKNCNNKDCNNNLYIAYKKNKREYLEVDLSEIENAPAYKHNYQITIYCNRKCRQTYENKLFKEFSESFNKKKELKNGK